jgi:hypothetical protein
MADHILAEALARVEFKLDLIMKHLKITAPVPMSYQGQSCPVCNFPVEYQVDISKQVVVRKCQCGTGKVVLDVKFTTQIGQPTHGQQANNLEDAFAQLSSILPSEPKKG